MTSPVRNQTHIRRIMSDVQQLYRENPTGIYITPQEDNLSVVHALLIGPKETPYENGFFYFLLKYGISTYTQLILRILLFTVDFLY